MPKIELCEQTKEDKKVGRVKFKASALELHIDDDELSHNNNGIKWIEEYVENNIDSAIGMPYVVSFIDSENTIPSNHGTMLHDDEGEVIFEDSEVVGYVEKAYITDMEINKKQTKVMMTEGYLYYQRFPNFVNFIREKIKDGEDISTSIEINHDNNNTTIVYRDGWKKVNRIPTEFSFTGLAILYLVGAGDDYAQIVEINSVNKGIVESNDKKSDDKTTDDKSDDINLNAEINNNKEDLAKMDELKEQIKDLTQQIVELNSAIAEKDAEINKCKDELNEAKAKETELNEAVVDATKTVESQKTEIAELNSAIEPLKELKAKVDADAKKAEINSYFKTIKDENGFSDAELNSLQTEYVDKCDLDGLKEKEIELCMKKVKDMKKVSDVDAEINEHTDDFTDLFFSTKVEKDAEINESDIDGADLFK